MKGLHELWTNIELNSLLSLLFLVYVVLFASNYNRNGSPKFQTLNLLFLKLCIFIVP